MQPTVGPGQVFILLSDKDEAAEMTDMLARSLPQQLHTSTVKVLKGELVAPIPPGDIVPRSDGQPPYNYHTLTREDPATFNTNDSDRDLAPLTPDEFDVLAGVSAPSARYRIFTNDLLEWGAKLKERDKVLVELPQQIRAASTREASPKVHAEIRYVGLVKTLPGITFGVEIKDKKYFGKGTSYGKFQDETYFLCKKGNGLFVSLDKLFPCHPQGISVTQPSSHHSMPPVEGIGQQGHTQPRSNSQRHQDNVIEVTNVSAAPATLEVGSSVELLGNPGRHGVIRWMGTLPGVRGTIAGVELDGPMEGCGDGEWSGRRYFTCLPGRAFFCPASSLRADLHTSHSRLKARSSENCGGGLSNMLVFTPHMLHRGIPANILGAMQDHESMHRLSKIGRTYPKLTVVPAEKAEPYVNITQGPHGLRVAHREPTVSNIPQGISYCPEDSKMVPATSTAHRQLSYPTNQTCPSQQQFVPQIPPFGQVPGPPQGTNCGQFQSNNIPQNSQSTLMATSQADPQPPAANHRQLHNSIPQLQNQWPQHQHSYIGHQESALHLSGCGWDGRRANNPTVFQNVPEPTPTVYPTTTVFPNVPNHLSSAEPTSSNSTLFQNIPPTTSCISGWDGARADPKNPTVFQNYPCQHSAGDVEPTTPTLTPSKTFSKVAPTPADSAHTERVENGWMSTEPACQASPYNSRDSLILNLPPPIITDFTSFGTDAFTRIPGGQSDITDSASGFYSLLSDTDQQGLGNLQTAHYEESHQTTMASSSPENGSSVDLYGSDRNLPTTPTNSLQSLQLGLDRDISPTAHRHTGLSSENGSSVDLYASPHSPTSPTNGIESVQPFLDTNNPPVDMNRQISSLSSENGSSVDLYGSPPSPLTPSNSLQSLQPFLDRNNPPVNTSRQRSFSFENGSSVDLYGCGPNSPTTPIKDHPSLPTVDRDEGEEDDIYSSGRLLPTQGELSSQAKATVSTDGRKFQPQQQPIKQDTFSTKPPLVRDTCSPGGRGKMEHSWICRYCAQLNISTVNPDHLP